MTLEQWISATGKDRAHWAKVFGLSPQQVAKLCTGTSKPSLETAAKIERLTNGIVRMQNWVSDDE